MSTSSPTVETPLLPGSADGGLHTLAAPVRVLLRRPAVTCTPESSVGDAARCMAGAGVGSIVVAAGDGRPLGIVTDTDLRAKVLARGRDGSLPLPQVMSAPVITIGAEALLLEALEAMARHGVRHLVVVDGAGRVEGVLSAGDLLLAQGRSPAAVLRAVEAAADLEALAAARARTVELLAELTRAGVEPQQITRVATAINDRAVRRALQWAEEETDAELAIQLGAPYQPEAFCWLALGSEGRQEQTLATDQDNALVYAATAGEAPAMTWLERFAERAVESLVRLGFPPCPGGVMASRPAWRRSLPAWQARVRGWVEEPTEQAMLESAIFFDFRPLYGDDELAARLGDTVRAEAPRNRIFLGHLAGTGLRRRPPLGFFRTFAVETGGAHRDTFNLKERGMAPLVDAARVLALAGGMSETSTWERFAAAAGRGVLSAELAGEAGEAFSFLMQLRLEHQLAQLERGDPPDNHLDPRTLGGLQRRTLKSAFQVVQAVQSAIGSRYGGYLAG